MSVITSFFNELSKLADLPPYNLGYNMSSDNGPNWISVLKIEEESTLKNTPNNFLNPKTGLFDKKYPKVFINYYLMFAATNEESYRERLKVIDGTIRFFQKNRVIDVTNVGNIRMDLISPSFEQLNQIWSLHGGKLYPNVIYKARVMQYEHLETEGKKVPAIKTISKTMSYEN